MNPSERKALHSAIEKTCLACSGRKPEFEMLRIYDDALAPYPLNVCLAALAQCYRQHRGHLAPADILDRIDDGWPTSNEAWALCPHDESQTVVWTPECARAFAASLGVGSDRTAQRMAFRESYERELSKAKAQSRQPKWEVSLGHDRDGRAAPIMAAVERGRLTPARAMKLIPPSDAGEHAALQALVSGVTEAKQLTGGTESPTGTNTEHGAG
jgi:hypothetical protein